MSLSKTHLPLGCRETVGSKCVQYAEDERDGPSTCCVCYDELKWCSFYDLKCGHEVCSGCMRGWLMTQLRTYGLEARFTCPMCRANHKKIVLVRDPQREIAGVSGVGEEDRWLHVLADAFGNYHTMLIETKRGCFVPDRPKGSVNVFKASQTVWTNPYSGWRVESGPPANNALFREEPDEPSTT